MRSHSARVSRTALIIARSLTFTRGDAAHRDLVHTESARLAWAALASHSRRDALLHRALCTPGLRWIVRAAETMVLPGIQLHFAARKRMIAEVAATAIDDDARQVVVIGAGFDALALRLSRRPERPVCIEVDHPATQAVKRAALARVDTTPGELRLVAADLATERLEPALARCGYDPAARTFFVIEGLTMYLQADQVTSLLTACASHAPSGSRIACTFMEPDDDGCIAFRRSRRGFVDRWLRVRGEPFTWGIHRDELPAFADTVGLDVIELADDLDLRRRYVADVANATILAAGELVCVMRTR